MTGENISRATISGTVDEKIEDVTKKL